MLNKQCFIYFFFNLHINYYHRNKKCMACHMAAFSSELYTLKIKQTIKSTKAWHPYQALVCKYSGTSINSRFSKWMTNIKCFSAELNMACHVHGVSINRRNWVSRREVTGYSQWGNCFYKMLHFLNWFVGYKYYFITGHFNLFQQ